MLPTDKLTGELTAKEERGLIIKHNDKDREAKSKAFIGSS